jgi:hypothetical protein
MNAEQVDQINEVAVLAVGLDYAGFKQKQLQNNKHETNIQRFHNIYGALPASCTQNMNNIQSDEMGLAIIRKPKLMHLLMTMYWLKAYVTETHQAGMFCLSPNTVRKWCWVYAKALQGLKSKKVRDSCQFMIYRLCQLTCDGLMVSYVTDCFAMGKQYATT